MPKLPIIHQLAAALTDPLPGWEAQRLLMPEGRDLEPLSTDLLPAAVLIALFPHNDAWYFPLIQRSRDGFAHSGQIALPGGRQEKPESDIETALREAEEEVNLPAKEIQILGMLSPLPIPVSQHLVQPVLGFMPEKPDLQPDPREVDHIFTVTLDEFIRTEIQFETRYFKARDWRIPYFLLQGHQVWGATAMILSEFRALLLQSGSYS